MKLPRGQLTFLKSVQKKRGHITLSELHQEALTFWRDFIDRRTGQLKAPEPAAPEVIALPIFPYERFADHAALRRALDDSWMMHWATAGRTIENVHVNPAIEAYTGHPAAYFRGGGWAAVVHPDDRAETLQKSEMGAKTLQPFCKVFRLRRKCGEFGSVIDYARPSYLLDEQFAGYIGTVHELSGPGTVCRMISDINNRALIQIIAEVSGREISRLMLPLPGAVKEHHKVH